MSLSIRPVEIPSLEGACAEMSRIGVDPAGARIMAPKQFHHNLKAEGLTSAQANVIKQEMLSAGGEAAVAKGAASCSVPTTGAIISGTERQFEILIEKLKVQSFGLPGVAAVLSEVFDNLRRRSFVIRGRDRSWEAGQRTLIMGILNITPDSFYDGGRFLDKTKAVVRALEMIEEGADIIDAGGESTRPGAEPVAPDEEIKRVVPVVEALSAKGIAVSVDTMKSEVARRSLEAGAVMINDVSALGHDPEMAPVAAEFGVPVVLMHMRGTPKTMQKDLVYSDLAGEVFSYLKSRLEFAVKCGIEKDKTIIDPGIGFGKTREANFELIGSLAVFRALGRPILVGASRKSFIGGTLAAGLEERLPGTLAAEALAVSNGAHILRVHDVKEARQAADMVCAVKNAALRASSWKAV